MTIICRHEYNHVAIKINNKCNWCAINKVNTDAISASAFLRSLIMCKRSVCILDVDLKSHAPLWVLEKWMVQIFIIES